jgi:uncharacterized protein
MGRGGGFMIEIPDRIPLFPLPDVVLFPQMPLPLHIFEPRYRQMVADANGTHATIGMTLLRPGWEPLYYGRPPVFSIGCAGRIEQCEALPDGRYNIVLRGLVPFQIVEEHVGAPYRVATVLPRPDREPAEAVERARDQLVEALERAGEQGSTALHGTLPPDVFVNVLSQSLELLPVERQSLLDCDSVVARSQRLVEILDFKRLERVSGSSSIH